MELFRVLYTRIRRNCEGVDMTHMGKVLNEELLMEKDFEEKEESFSGSDVWTMLTRQG